MIFYPYNSPIILTDALYLMYGGVTGTTTDAQRQAAYLMAEEEVSGVLETLLLPTIVTGTYPYNPTKGGLVLDYAYVNSIIMTRFLDSEETIYWSQAGTNNIYVSLRDDERGIVDLHYLVGNCGCHTAWRPFPYQIQMVFNAGLPSGTSYHPNILMALTTYATIIVNEMIGFGNEAPGDIGVQEFRNQAYWESRVGLFKTALGSSPKAHFANRLLNKLKRRRWVSL